MPLTLDHVVILVTDLGRAIEDYAALGFTVQRGGIHADGATHNALVGFADGSYLELIAFLRPAPQHRWAAAATRGHEGYVDYALLPEAVGPVVQAARALGLGYRGPLPGGRLRPDGQRLAWQIGTPLTPDLPFLCGDLTPRALRVPEGEVRVHANGVRGVAAVTVLVADLDASLARYRALLGADATLDAAGIGVRQARFALGLTSLTLLAPGPDPDSPLRASLAQRGEGVVGLALHGTQPGVSRSLPLAQTHGAAIELIQD